MDALADSPMPPDSEASAGQPQVGPDMSALGTPPAGFDPERMPIMAPPSDVPPVPALQPAQVGAQGGGGGPFGGDRAAPSKDPHWVYVPTSVLIANESYWARQEGALLAGERAGDPDAKAALDYLRSNGTEQWRATCYCALTSRKHWEGYPQLYAPEILHVQGLAPLVELERQAWRAEQSAAGARGRQAAIRTRIAAMDDLPPKYKAAVMVALEEVAGEEVAASA